MRKSTKVPIIFLTARDTEADMIEGFRAGCDDYIAKPFSVELLYQRIEAVLRRSENALDGVKCERFHYGDMSVDFERMQVYISDEPIKLSVTEYRILELLIKNKGRVLTRDMIIQKIWDDNENYVDENTLNVHIRRLRQKIEKDAGNPEYVITVFGIGYTFGET
nr:response regulator transcription factor [Coprococcus sp. OM06-25]